MEDLNLPIHLPAALNVSPEACSIVAGCFAFGSSLALSTLAQGKLLGISTGSVRPLPTVMGMVSVGLATMASHHSSIAVHRAMRDDDDNYYSRGTCKKNWSRRHDEVSIGEVTVSKHALRICALGLLSFKLLGGRFWAIAPSSYKHVGSFARASIPATDRYATQAERSLLMRAGRKWGCHTCGTRIVFGRSVIADHQPPKAVAKQMDSILWRRLFGVKTKFRFYPQCTCCSQKQGSILSTATRQASSWWNRTQLSGSGGGRLANYHGFKFRLNHLAGGVVAATTVVGATDTDIANGNFRRFAKWQDSIQRSISPLRPSTTRTPGLDSFDF